MIGAKELYQMASAKCAVVDKWEKYLTTWVDLTFFAASDFQMEPKGKDYQAKQNPKQMKVSR